MIKKYLSDVEKLWKENNFKELSGSVDEKKLVCLYSLYHYFYGDEDHIIDVNDGVDFKVSIENDVQGCFEPDSYDDKIVDIIGCSFADDENPFNIGKIKNILSQIQNNVIQIKEKSYYAGLNILKDHIDSQSKENIVIKVLTNYVPEYDEKSDLLEIIEKMTPMYEYIKFELLFGDDIVDEITQLTSDKKCVEQGNITIDMPDNYLRFGNENSVIVNVSARSIKDNYIKYGKAGLFSMNLRFYIANKKVDAGIEESVKNRGDNFWYYNNGIIIVCDDYIINGTNITLYNYSIVNGGQTTRMIGVIPFEKDFYVSCKIIKNKYIEDREENARFVSEIAEASNTQKPINSTDIIANKPEQRLLKENLSNVGVFVQIKRGDAASANVKENYPLAWQKTKNDELAQILYGGIYQKPGTARNSKDKIFSDKKKYQLVFGGYNEKKYTNEYLRDLLYIRTYYKKWATKIAKDDSENQTKKGIAKNGFLFFTASILLMAKLLYSKDLREFMKEAGYNSEKGIYTIGRNTFNHRLFSENFDDLESRMYELFNVIYDRYVGKGFMKAREIRPDLVYSNFTKIDKNYVLWVGTEIFEDFCDEKIPSVLFKLFHTETDVEIDETSALVEDAMEAYDNREIDEEEIEDEIAEKIVELLKEFRTKTYKERGIKAYDVFTNIEMNTIAKLKPRTVKDLQDFGCFKNHPWTKTKYYGESIVELVVSVCGKKEN